MALADMPPLEPELRRKTERLHAILRGGGATLVAFSGGVDSAVLLAEAREVLGPDAVGVLAVSPSLPRSELEEARRVAAEIGARLVEVATREAEDPRYRANAPDRCFFCKDALFTAMEEVAAREGARTVAYGAITDDRGDFRPGMDAARRHRAVAPLLEAAIGKAEVRVLARRRGLSVWDKPAKACLASRIPHGTEVTPLRLGRIERAEEVLRREGFRQYRVRDHGEVARLEVDPAEMDRLGDPALRDRVAEGVRAAGFRFVAVDLGGYRSGSLNPEGPAASPTGEPG